MRAHTLWRSLRASSRCIPARPSVRGGERLSLPVVVVALTRCAIGRSSPASFLRARLLYVDCAKWQRRLAAQPLPLNAKPHGSHLSFLLSDAPLCSPHKKFAAAVIRSSTPPSPARVAPRRALRLTRASQFWAARGAAFRLDNRESRSLPSRRSAKLSYEHRWAFVGREPAADAGRNLGCPRASNATSPVRQMRRVRSRDDANGLSRISSGRAIVSANG